MLLIPRARLAMLFPWKTASQTLRDIQNLPRIHYPQPWVRELVMEQVASIYASISRAGFDVDRWFQQLPAHAILDAGHSICLCLHPVTYWTHRGHQPVADFIGRVENFEADFDRMTRRYGITGMPHRDANRSDPQLARPDRHNYLYAQGLAPRTIAKINELFSADFELLGYPKIVPPPSGAAVTLTRPQATREA